jgi:calcium-dependent protein kinase
MFRVFDKNSDGKISKQELKEGYENYMGKVMSDDEVDAIFKKIDIDASGFIDYNEFLGAAMSMEIMMS